MCIFANFNLFGLNVPVMYSYVQLCRVHYYSYVQTCSNRSNQDTHAWHRAPNAALPNITHRETRRDSQRLEIIYFDE